MTPEAWQVVILIVTGLCGSGGVWVAINYVVKTIADIRRMRAETAKDVKIKSYEAQVIRLQAAVKKSESDERQQDRQQSDEAQTRAKLIDMLSNTIGRLDTVHARLSSMTKQIEITEDNMSDWHLELRTIIEREAGGLRAYNTGLKQQLEDHLVNIVDLFKKAIVDAVDMSQQQSAGRETAKNLSGLRYPSEHDRNWKLCQLSLRDGQPTGIFGLPFFINNNALMNLPSDETVWFIEEALSYAPGWCPVKLVNMPEMKGWVRSHRVIATQCEDEKKSVNGRKVYRAKSHQLQRKRSINR